MRNLGPIPAYVIQKNHTRHNRHMRCGWAEGDELYEHYHDTEWGVPNHDDRHLFEMLILEGAQAGLSWITILRRREGYRRAYDEFDPKVVAKYTEKDSERLLSDPGIIRNRAKVAASINNAQRFLEVQEEFGSFDKYAYQFVGGKPIVNHRKSLAEIPAVTPEAEAFSKDLRNRGFKFVGPTIIYAHMQAAGMVNDHLVSCPRHAVCAKLI